MKKNQREVKEVLLSSGNKISDKDNEDIFGTKKIRSAIGALILICGQ